MIGDSGDAEHSTAEHPGGLKPEINFLKDPNNQSCAAADNNSPK